MRAALFSVLASILLPGVGRRVRRQHRLGVEQLCDRAAADEVDVLAAADALISVARNQSEAEQTGDSRANSVAALSFGADQLNHRVEALVGESTESPTRIDATGFLVGAIAASLLTSPWLHRGIDTLMNHFL
jgi:hypothetical protein